MADDVFDDDDRAVNDHAEIESAEREKIGGNFVEVEADGGEQQRERNGERDDERAAEIAEEEKEDDGDEQDAFGEIVQDGVRGEMHQVAAVEERDDLHAGREDLFVQLVNFVVNGDQGFVGVGALAKQDDAFDDVIIVDNRAVFAVNGLADLSEANLGALRDRGDIFHAEDACRSCAVMTVCSMSCDVGEQADDADVDLLQAGLDETAAGVGVVVGELLLDLADAEAVGDEFVGIDADLIFAGDAAEAGDVHDVGNGFELLSRASSPRWTSVPSGRIWDWCCAACTSKSGRRGSSRCPSAAADCWEA